MIVLGLSGKRGCGKTTTAQFLAAMCPAATVVSFADPVREGAAHLLGIPVSEFRTNKDRKIQLGGRTVTLGQFLAIYGTDVVREIRPDYWVERMKTRIQGLAPNHPLIIIDDVRFMDEAALIHGTRYWLDHGPADGLVVRLEPYPEMNVATFDSRDPSHRSETALDHYDGFTFKFTPEKGMLAGVAASIFDKLHEHYAGAFLCPKGAGCENA